MKCQIIRDDLELSGPPPAFHDEQWEEREIFRNRRLVKARFWKKGAILDHPEAHALVQHGCAVPADEACQVACAMTPEMIRAAIHAQNRVSLGIHPTDFEKFDAGEILGYHPNGDYIHGPNWKADKPDIPLSEPEDEDEH